MRARKFSHRRFITRILQTRHHAFSGVHPWKNPQRNAVLQVTLTDDVAVYFPRLKLFELTQRCLPRCQRSEIDPIIHSGSRIDLLNLPLNIKRDQTLLNLPCLGFLFKTSKV